MPRIIVVHRVDQRQAIPIVQQEGVNVTPFLLSHTVDTRSDLHGDDSLLAVSEAAGVYTRWGHADDRLQAVTSSTDARFERWLAALDERHLANLTQSEVTRALRALSSCYVERREKLVSGGPLDSAGKRGAFALFYAPLHFIVVRKIVSAETARGDPDVTSAQVRDQRGSTQQSPSHLFR